MKVLIAEDDVLLLRLLTDRFNRENLNVIICGDGQKAKEMFDIESPDLVITDLQMPFSSGTELIYHIRDVRQSKIPIIVLSSTSVEDKIIDTLKLGANDFIEKPFRLNELIVRANKLLNEQHSIQNR